MKPKAYWYISTLNVFGNKLLLLFWAYRVTLGLFSQWTKHDTRTLGMRKEDRDVETE